MDNFKPWFSYDGLHLEYYRSQTANESKYWDKAMHMLCTGRGLYFNIITGEIR
jgi:hypothetical protein